MQSFPLLSLWRGAQRALLFRCPPATTAEGGCREKSAAYRQLAASWNAGSQKRFAHKYAAPECPNLLKLRAVIEQNLEPICFYLKNDYAMGHHVYDQHFYGILCSPLFEGKSYKQINAMVDRVLEPIGMKGRVKLHCQPPSRFEKLRRRVHWRWQLEK